MSGISIGTSQPRSCSGEKTLRRCRNNKADNIILIDVDSENVDDVIFIDFPESLPKKKQGSSMLRKDRCQSRNVINIDDDDDEVSERNRSIGVNDINFSAGTSTNRKSFRVGQEFETSADVAVKDSQFVQEKATPVRLSKCKRTYSGLRRNHYGLDSDSECDSSDNDYSDCELVEDSSGKVKKQWEKAFSRRRQDIHNGHSCIRDHDSASRCIRKDYRQYAESENDASSSSRAKGDSDFGWVHLCDDSIHNQKHSKSDARGQCNSKAKYHPSFHVEQADCLDREPGSSSIHTKERRKNPVSSSFASQESTRKFNRPVPEVQDEETSEPGSCPPEFEVFVYEDSSDGKSSEPTISKSKSAFECEIKHGRSFGRDNHKNVQERATRNVEEGAHLRYGQSDATGVTMEMENLMPQRCSFERSTLPDKQIDLSSGPSCDAVDASGRSAFPKSDSSSIEGEKGNLCETTRLAPEVPLFGSILLSEAKLQEDNSVSGIQQQKNEDGQLDRQNGDPGSPMGTCLINDREKIKETEEYKRAIEEEWASRQQALLIQAEEARHLRQLRKRKKAESMRLLDMERRQKQRLEEMRNTQKKDEENMNLKETIRAEVRNELNKLEIQCKNMASLLHLLGIQVGSWPNPSPREVQTAYKRALLTFHPDRASQSDIRHQVEAEEKFKLINRLKEKFPLK